METNKSNAKSKLKKEYKWGPMPEFSIEETLVKCKICGAKVHDWIRYHVEKVHGLRSEEYRAQFPTARVVSVKRRWILTGKYTPGEDWTTDWSHHKALRLLVLEGKDVADVYVTCQICGKQYANLNSHLKHKHNVLVSEYKRMYPESPTVGKSTADRLCNALRGTTEEDQRRIFKLKSEAATKRNKRLHAEGILGSHQLKGSHEKSVETMQIIKERREKLESKMLTLLLSLGVKFFRRISINRLRCDFVVESYTGKIKVIDINEDYKYANPTIVLRPSLKQVRAFDKKAYKADLLGKGNILYVWEEDLLKRRDMCIEVVKKFLSEEYDKLNSFEFDRRPINADN